MNRKSIMNFIGQIRAFVGSPLTLDIKNGVGELFLYDFIDPYWGISADAVVKALAGKTMDKLVVHINSPGGDVFDGWAIYNYLKSRPYPVETINDGSAASIASIILMAGSVVKSSAHALMMVHNPWMMSMGNAKQLREDADLLDKVAADLRQIYMKKSGMSEADIMAMLEAETWLNAEESLAAKLVDEIIADNGAGDEGMAARAAGALYNRIVPEPKQVKDDPQNDGAASRRARAKALTDIAAL